MISTTTEFDAQIKKDSRTFRARFLKNDSPISGDIKKITINKGACGDNFSIGSVYSSYIEVTLDNCTDSLEDEELQLQIGLVINGSVEYIDIGYYTVTKPKASAYLTTFTAVGRIASKLNKLFDVPEVLTLENIAAAITAATGVTIIFNGEVSNSALGKDITGMTCKEALSLIASTFGGFATEDNSGNIIVSKYTTDIKVSVDGERMTSLPEFNDYDYELYGVKVIVSAEGQDEEGNTIEEVAFTEGTPRLILTNEFMTADLFESFAANSMGYTYRPGTVPLALGDPRLQPWDCLEVTDVKGNVHTVPCLNIVHTFDGGLSTAITAPGESESASSSNVAGPVIQQLERLNLGLLSAQEAILKRLKTEELKAEVAKFGYATVGELTAINADVINLKAKSAEIQGSLTATDAQIASISGEMANFRSGEFMTLVAKVGEIDEAYITSAEVNTLIAGKGYFTLAQAETLIAGKGFITELETKNLLSDYVKTETLESDYVRTTVLESNYIKTGELESTVGTFGYLKATDANLTFATITDLNAANAAIGSLDSTYATLDLANVTTGAIKNAMIDTGAVGTAQIADGSITDAKIVELTANKITAGMLSVERLVIRGSAESIVYALNDITGAVQAQSVDTLNGEVLTPRTITADRIVANAITSEEIASRTITANNIVAGTITTTELDAAEIFANTANIGKIVATDTFSNAVSANTVVVSANKTAADALAKATTVDGVVSGWCYSDTTLIDGGKISTGTITAAQIDVTDLFAQTISASGSVSGLKFISEGKDDSGYPSDMILDAGALVLESKEGAYIFTTNISAHHTLYKYKASADGITNYIEVNGNYIRQYLNGKAFFETSASTGVITVGGEMVFDTGTVQSATKGIKWSAINTKKPYIGYATDQTDGTFVLGSLTGTNYASGLAIGGGSGNLLWKGSKVAVVSDISLSTLGITASAAELNYVKGVTSAIQTQLNGKAASGHTHSEYAAAGHTHSGYAVSGHTHSNYAATGHSHSEYAVTGHTHSYQAVNKMCSGEISSTSVSAGEYKDVSVTFPFTFSSKPKVVAGLYSTSTSADLGSISVAVTTWTTSGCTLRIFNASSAQRSPAVHWIAVLN